MWSTSLTPIILSVPPVCGVPLPGFTAWKPGWIPLPDAGAVEPPPPPPVVVLLLLELHAAPSSDSATAPATAPKACGRKRLVTLLLLFLSLLGEGRSRKVEPCGTPPRRSMLATCDGHGQLSSRLSLLEAEKKYRECHGMQS